MLSAQMGKGDRRIYFYAVVEQQREVEALMVFRMGVYMMRLWEQLVRDQPGLQKLPPIVPVLIHHSDTGCAASSHTEARSAGLTRGRRSHAFPPGILSP